MKINNGRIQSIDFLRGVVMIIMALDHVRDYFYYGSFFNDPTNLETTTPVLFFTRFITHYCAPIFVFLAGTSAFLYGSKKPKKELFGFLLSRGLWLIFLELLVNNFIWTFDTTFSFPILQVIWAIGFSMVCLSFLIFLPKKFILIIGLLILFGHNLLDSIQMQGEDLQSILWYLLHQQKFVAVDGILLGFQYPVLAWIGVMALGYCFGTLYQIEFPFEKRKRLLLGLGLGAIAMFFMVRGVNIYGDLVPWTPQPQATYTLLSFFNTTKYPPSLSYLLMTLGPGMLFLYAFENMKNSVVQFFVVFGRVPLFYYFLHVLVIHLLAMLGIELLGGNWRIMILNAEAFISGDLATYGYPLWVTYIVWIAVVAMLYPLCNWYKNYKAENKEKWWLSYL